MAEPEHQISSSFWPGFGFVGLALLCFAEVLSECEIKILLGSLAGWLASYWFGWLAERSLAASDDSSVLL